MERIFHEHHTYILRFARGEEVVSLLTRFCGEEGIEGAWFEGIGATDNVEIGLYDPHTKGYDRKVFTEELEVTGLKGNIALVDGKQFLHAHVTLARPDFSVLGGHLYALRISATCEVMLTRLSGPLRRAFDEETALKLLTGKNP